MSVDINQFLISALAAKNAGVETDRANRLALVTGMMNLDLVQSVVITRAIAQREALSGTPAEPRPDEPDEPVPGLGAGRERQTKGGEQAQVEQVRAPDVSELGRTEDIYRRLQSTNLELQVYEVRTPDPERQKVLLQCPAPGSQVDPGTVVQVVLGIPTDDRASQQAHDARAARSAVQEKETK